MISQEVGKEENSITIWLLKDRASKKKQKFYLIFEMELSLFKLTNQFILQSKMVSKAQAYNIEAVKGMPVRHNESWFNLYISKLHGMYNVTRENQ